jgi:hypothetical protein
MSEEKEYQCPCPEDLPEYIGGCGEPGFTLTYPPWLFHTPPPSGPLERIKKLMLTQAVESEETKIVLV